MTLASLVAAFSCNVDRSPSRPSPATLVPPTTAPALTGPGAGESGVVGGVVAWRCMALTPFRSADCAPPTTPSLHSMARPTALTAPSMPDGLVATVTGTTVRLTWTAPPGGDAPASYIVEAGSAPGRTDLANFDTGNAAPALTVDDVPAGAYFVRVRARDSAGVSAPSNEVALRVTGPSPCTALPAAPTALAASVIDTAVRLTWSAPAVGCAATSYVLEAGSATGLSNLARFNTGTAATSFSAEGVAPGTYFVRVRAANANGAGAPSNEITLTTASPCVPPSAPTMLTSLVQATTVTLSWSAASGSPTSYIVELGSPPGGSNVAVTETGNLTTFAADLPPGTYFARVRAKNSCGTGSASNEITVTVEPPPCMLPSAPAGLSVSAIGTTVALSWIGSSLASSYVVEVGTSPGQSDVGSSDTGSTATALTTTLPAGTYFVRVRAANSCGQSGTSNEVRVTVQSPPAPPTSTTITIAASGVSPKTLEVAAGTQVTFFNNDRVVHEMNSDPHPEHDDCPEINQVGFIAEGQRKLTGNLNTPRTCGFHDHLQPDNRAFQGTIIIR